MRVCFIIAFIAFATTCNAENLEFAAFGNNEPTISQDTYNQIQELMGANSSSPIISIQPYSGTEANTYADHFRKLHARNPDIYKVTNPVGQYFFFIK